MTNTKKIWISIIVLAVALIGSLGWSRMGNQEREGAQPSASPSTGSGENWNTVTVPPYTLQYPSEARAETQANESIVFFMGQKQIDSGRTQTELFDGYSVRVGVVPFDASVSLEQLAQTEWKNAQAHCQTQGGQIAPVQPATVSGQAAFQYSAKGCYMDYTETFVSFKGGTYRITQAYIGDAADQNRYQDITNNILLSLRFTN